LQQINPKKKARQLGEVIMDQGAPLG